MAMPDEKEFSIPVDPTLLEQYRNIGKAAAATLTQLRAISAEVVRAKASGALIAFASMKKLQGMVEQSLRPLGALSYYITGERTDFEAIKRASQSAQSDAVIEASFIIGAAEALAGRGVLRMGAAAAAQRAGVAAREAQAGLSAALKFIRTLGTKVALPAGIAVGIGEGIKFYMLAGAVKFAAPSVFKGLADFLSTPQGMVLAGVGLYWWVNK
jgi:hypothetical protein